MKDNLFNRPFDTAFMFDAAGAGEGAGEGSGGAEGGGGGPVAGGEPTKTEPLTFEKIIEAAGPDYKDAKWAQSYKGEEGLKNFFKSHGEALKLVGRKREELIPGENATPEEWNQFYALLGRPEDPTGYGLKAEDIQAMGIPTDNGFLERFTGVAHQLGLSPKQVSGLVDWQAEEMSQAMGQNQATYENAMNELRGIWGGAVERHVTLGNRAIESLLGEEGLKWARESGAGNDVTFVKMMAKIGNMMAERGLIDGDVEGVPGVEDAYTEANRIVFEKEHPLHKAYHDEAHPNHQHAVQRVQTLYGIKYNPA